VLLPLVLQTGTVAATAAAAVHAAAAVTHLTLNAQMMLKRSS
jgi:hypothetical protein